MSTVGRDASDLGQWLFHRDEPLTARPDEMRVRAVSRILAAEARQRNDVQAFRTEILGDALLHPEHVGDWVQDQARREGEPSVWLSGLALPASAIQVGKDGWVKLDAPVMRFKPLWNLELQEIPSLSRRHILYLVQHAAPPVWLPASTDVVAGGVLDRLRKLSDELSDTYLWEPDQASMFALTDYVPLAEPYAVALERMRGRRTLEMSEKHMTLAVYFAEHPEGTHTPRMAAWNEAYPQWAYDRVTNFGTHARDAVTRLVGAPGERPQPGTLSRLGHDLRELERTAAHRAARDDLERDIQAILSQHKQSEQRRRKGTA